MREAYGARRPRLAGVPNLLGIAIYIKSLLIRLFLLCRGFMKQFTKRTENFKCEHCGTEVIGNGYTNHCPHCLYSKHVDINPGDRASDCGGLMEPIDAEMKNGEYFIIQRCQKCGFIRKNKFGKDDEFDALLQIMKNKTIALKG